MPEDTYADTIDDTPYLESDDGSHRSHVGEAIAMFGDLRELF